MKNSAELSISGINTGHVQGIATDARREYMYYSFTTCLIKTDMQGNIIGSVKGLAGHLGCIAYNYDDGRVYGSLEYKHDSIGKSILGGLDRDVEDGFYIAVFDVGKIDRMDMDAEKDGIMTAVFLKEVTDDFLSPGHRYGCSGIDGFTFAPLPGGSDKKYIYVAYGIYGNTDRTDNDHQVILRYDAEKIKKYEAPLDQDSMHRQGPDAPEDKYFVYTGNTEYGIQNLEYDGYTNCMFAAVYIGKKKKFPNYPMFIIDMSKAAVEKSLTETGETGKVLTLAEFCERDKKSGICGCNFPYGSTGMISLGDGEFYFSEDFHNADGYGTDIRKYRFDKDKGFLR